MMLVGGGLVAEVLVVLLGGFAETGGVIKPVVQGLLIGLSLWTRGRWLGFVSG